MKKAKIKDLKVGDLFIHTKKFLNMNNLSSSGLILNIKKVVGPIVSIDYNPSILDNMRGDKIGFMAYYIEDECDILDEKDIELLSLGK